MMRQQRRPDQTAADDEDALNSRHAAPRRADRYRRGPPESPACHGLGEVSIVLGAGVMGAASSCCRGYVKLFAWRTYRVAPPGKESPNGRLDECTDR